MWTLQAVRTIIRRVFLVLGASFAIIIISFIFHILQVNKYNNLERYDTPETVSMDVTADIHPRGLLTDSWEKNDAFENTIINGKIYETTITNNSKSLLVDWKLRVNIKESCWINNAWTGLMEIHQFVGGEEKVQTLDLRNYSAEDITLDYVMGGQDLLIPLNSGDYFIYHPYEGADSGEVPIKSSKDFAGQTNIGFILYSLSGENDLSDFVMTYHIHKSYFAGPIGMTFMVLIPLWLMLMLILGIIAWIVLYFESTLFYQSQIITDMFGLCSTLADEKDYYHNGHSIRVANFSRKIAETMGMDKQDCDIVYYGALLHNIGNYAVPERILGKTTPLTPEDEKVVQMHTIKGSKLTENMKSMPQAALATLYHHERYDGSGYPTGKKGEEIPLIARIIAVADNYDDMIHERAYRGRYTPDEIKQFYKDNSGTWFDPLVVDVFVDMVDSMEE